MNGGMDAGQAQNSKGWLESFSESVGSIFPAGTDPSMVSGGGVGSPAPDPLAPVRPSFAELFTQNAVKGLPGAGSLWNYTATGGLSLTGTGKMIMLAIGGLMAFAVVSGGRR
jgi:hypothetical protein